jgi:hypothetical protein
MPVKNPYGYMEPMKPDGPCPDCAKLQARIDKLEGLLGEIKGDIVRAGRELPKASEFGKTERQTDLLVKVGTAMCCLATAIDRIRAALAEKDE